MKKIKYTILSLFLVTIGIGLYSCSDDMIKSDYDYEMDKSATLASVSFLSLEKIDDENISLKAEITSKGDSEIYDQGFIYSTDQSFAKYEVYSVKASAESSTTIEVEEMSLDQGQDFYFKAYVLAKDGMSVSSEVKSINLPITWETAGTVIFTDGFWNGESAEVEIQKFFGQNRYRLVDLYYHIDQAAENKDIPKGKHFIFYLDDDGNADYIANGDQDIFVAPYMFHYDKQSWGSYSKFSNKDNVYEIGAVVKESGVVTYVYTGSFEWVDGYPGEIPEPAVVTYKNDFSTDADRAGWVMDKYSGWGEDDNAFFFDLKEIGAPNLGTSIATYYEGETLKIISPAITVGSEDDILSFSYYSGVFGSEDTKVKVYIREAGTEIDYNSPVAELELEAVKTGRVSIPVGQYEEKSIKLIFVVEQGDFLFYRLAIADTDDAGSIFK